MEYKIIFGFKSEKELQEYLASLNKLPEDRKKKSLKDIEKFGYVKKNDNNDKKRSK